MRDMFSRLLSRLDDAVDEVVDFTNDVVADVIELIPDAVEDAINTVRREFNEVEDVLAEKVSAVVNDAAQLATDIGTAHEGVVVVWLPPDTANRYVLIRSIGGVPMIDKPMVITRTAAGGLCVKFTKVGMADANQTLIFRGREDDSECVSITLGNDMQVNVTVIDRLGGDETRGLLRLKKATFLLRPRAWATFPGAVDETIVITRQQSSVIEAGITPTPDTTVTATFREVIIPEMH